MPSRVMLVSSTARGQPEVGQASCSGRVIDQDVARLDVAMHQSQVMHRSQARGHVAANANRILNRQRPMLGNALLERLAGDVLENEVGQTSGFVYGVNGNHVRAMDSGRGAGLAKKPLAGRGIGRDVRCENFQAHVRPVFRRSP